MDPLSPAQPPRKSHSFPDYFSTSQAAPRFRERLLAVTFYAILMLSCQICEKGPTMFCLYTLCTIFIFAIYFGNWDDARLMEMQARGCESVTQDVMAEVISPAGAKFLRKLSFNSWHTVPESRTLPERRADRAREHSCPQSNPAVSLNLCHRGSTKNDPESNSKESQQVEASNRSRKTRKRILYLCM